MRDSQRIDKWLFFARIARSRSLAASLVSSGHVRVNKEKVTKPAYALTPGDVAGGHERGLKFPLAIGIGSAGTDANAHVRVGEIDLDPVKTIGGIGAGGEVIGDAGVGLLAGEVGE